MRHSKVAIAVAAAMGGMLLTSTLAQAETASVFQMLNKLPRVSDQTLAHMRGRYITPDQVVYFGVQMETKWQTQSGQIITGSVNLGIPASGAGVQFNASACIDSQCSSTGNGSESSGNGGQYLFSLPASAGGLKSASGVVQSIQVAANRNTVNNSIQMDVVSSGGGTGAGGFLLDGTGSGVSQSSNGTVVAAGLGKEGLGISATLPGQQQIVQQISNGNIMQSTFVQSDMNMITNTIQLNIGVQNAVSGIGTANIGAALQTLNGVSLMGLH